MIKPGGQASAGIVSGMYAEQLQRLRPRLKRRAGMARSGGAFLSGDSPWKYDVLGRLPVFAQIASHHATQCRRLSAKCRDARIVYERSRERGTELERAGSPRSRAKR